MNFEAIWHDLECGGYVEDLPLWRELTSEASGAVLDVGAGTGRVTLDLASRGVEMVALDINANLLEALACRAAGLPVQTVTADARHFELERRFSAILVPMQTLQLLGGNAGRIAFLRRALEHLEPGGLIAAALGDAIGCFDPEHDAPPPPDTWDVLGVRYSSQLVSVIESDGQAVLRWRRETIGGAEAYRARDVLVHLDRVSPAEVAAEARWCGFREEPHRLITETEQYLGSTVVIARAPRP